MFRSKVKTIPMKNLHVVIDISGEGKRESVPLKEYFDT